jgi:AraC-like DNA-binding protein
MGSVESSFDVVSERSVERLRDRLSDNAGIVAALILENRDINGRSTLPLIPLLRSWMPHVAIIGYCEAPQVKTGALFELARAGVDDVIFRSFDDGGRLLQAALDSAQRSCAATRVLAQVRPSVDPSIHSIIEYGVNNGQSELTVAGVAAALGVHRRTLVSRCRHAGLPSPQIVLGWCRVFLAAGLLEHPFHTVEHIANELDFPSVSALRNLLRRYVGATATDIRRAGGLDFVVSRFLTAVQTPPT